MSTSGLARLTVTPKTGAERFHAGGRDLGHDLLGFWRWSASDLVSNATRGVLAEYLVACAVGLEGGLRAEWDAFDLRTGEGVTVEVKSAAYLQTWHQARESAISFDIRPTMGWDAATNNSGAVARRQADVYVFALLHHRDKATVDPLDATQWTFHVVPTATLDARFPTQRRLGLGALLALGPTIADFDGLAPAIAAASGRGTRGGAATGGGAP
jgi:hypothetical protein